MIVKPFFMALRGIRAYKGRSVLALLGIAIAAFLVISLMSVLYNFKNGLLNQFNGAGAKQITVVPGKLLNKQAMSSGVADLSAFTPSSSTLTYKDAMDAKKNVAGISKAAPQNEAVTTLSFKQKTTDIIFTGTNPDLPGVFDLKLAEGSFFFWESSCKQRKGCCAWFNRKKKCVWTE